MCDRIRLWRYVDQSAEKKYAPRIAIMKVTILWPLRTRDVAQRYQGFEGNCWVNLKGRGDILPDCTEPHRRTVIYAVTTVKTLNVTGGIYFFFFFLRKNYQRRLVHTDCRAATITEILRTTQLNVNKNFG
jgi:hypothetical protein